PLANEQQSVEIFFEFVRSLTIPGVGPVIALTYRVTVDVPARFRNSKAVGGGIWIDTCQVSVGRDRPNRRNITVWRRDDADDALRSSPEHAGAFDEMVLAQGLGDEDCQAPRDEEGDRCPGASVGRDHASHLGRWHRIPMDQGGRRSVRTVRDQIRYEKT